MGQKVSDEQVINAVYTCKSAREAGRLLGIHQSSFIKRATKLGVYDILRLKQNKNRAHSVDDNAFKVMCKACAYWLGYIAADGSIVNNTLRFSIARVDKQHLYRFIEFLKSNYEVHDHIAHYTDSDGIQHNFEACYLKIYSNEIVRTLSNFGIVQGKKYKDINYLMYIPDNYKLEFIFGLFDGDGSVGTYNYSKVITICSTKSMTQNLINTLRLYNIEASIQHRKSIDVIYIYGSNIKEFYKLYNTEYRLKRKVEIFNNILN